MTPYKHLQGFTDTGLFTIMTLTEGLKEFNLWEAYGGSREVGTMSKVEIVHYKMLVDSEYVRLEKLLNESVPGGIRCFQRRAIRIVNRQSYAYSIDVEAEIGAENDFSYVTSILKEKGIETFIDSSEPNIGYYIYYCKNTKVVFYIILYHK